VAIRRPDGIFKSARQVLKALFLRGQGQANDAAEVIWSGSLVIFRYGARAFSTLEGYASRNRETELASGLVLMGLGRAATVAILV
jgi:hypothetical protein